MDDALTFEAIVQMAGGLEPGPRVAYLDRICGGDTVLRRRVEEAMKTVADAPTEAPRDSAVRQWTAPALGEAIGGYRLEAVLGRGGFGVVYRARHPDRGVAALKTVRAIDSLFMASFRREIRALARLHHPGIVRILEQGIHRGLPWYSMELVDGLTIMEFLKREGTDGPGGLQRKVSLIRRLCEPLAYLHSEGLVHRDLKPDNVLVRAEGRPVIIDFGLVARTLDSTSREALEIGGQAAGTALYMSPEQCRGETVDARSDLYSLGCMLYELMAGRPPFGGSPTGVMKGHMFEPAEALTTGEGVPADLNRLVMRLLAKEPRERLGFVDDVAQSLERLGAAGEAMPSVRPYLYRPGLMGRDEELARGKKMILDARRKSGSILLLGGESGVGKTKLASALGSLARQRGFMVLTGECSAGRNPPLGLFAGPLRAMADYCRQHGPEATGSVFGDGASVLAPLEPSLSDLPGARVTPPEADPERARQRVLDTAAETLSRMSEQRPLLIVLDDVQWADELSAALLLDLAASPRLASQRVMILCTCRTDRASDWVETFAGGPQVTRMMLGRLRSGAVASLVADMLAAGEAPAALLQQIEDRAEGNPLFAAEYLRLAVDRGILARRLTEGSLRTEWTLDESSGDLSVPGSISEILAGRMRVLTNAARSVMEVAAVFSRPVPAALLVRAAGGQDSENLDALQELQRRHILEETATELAFSHQQLAESVLDQLDPLAARALHRRVAEVIEDYYPDAREGRAAELARHWEAAGEVGRALELYEIATDVARSRFAPREVVELLTRRIELTDDPALCNELRDGLGLQLYHLGRYHEAEAVHRVGIQDAIDLNLAVAEGSHRHGLATTLNMLGRVEEAREEFRRTIATYEAMGDDDRVVRATTDLAYVEYQGGSLDEAAAILRRTIEFYSDLEDPVLRAQATTLLGIVAGSRGNHEESRELHRSAVEIFRGTEARNRLAFALVNLAAANARIGDYEASRATNEEAIEILEELREFRVLSRVWSNVGIDDYERGDFARAVQAFSRGLDLARAESQAHETVDGVLGLARIRLAEGDVEAVDRLVQECEELLGGLIEPRMMMEFLAFRAHLDLARGGDGTQARARMDRWLASRPERPDLLEFVEKVDAAMEARATERLVLGYRERDLPAGVVAWLAENRPELLQGRS